MKKSLFSYSFVLCILILFTCTVLIAQSWLPVKRLTWNDGGSWAPQIAVDASHTLHMVWFDNNPGNEEIFHKRSTNNGMTWSKATRLTWESQISYNPWIAADSLGNIYVVWMNLDPVLSRGDLFFKKSTDSGTTWSPPSRLTWTGLYYDPGLTVDDDDNIHVVFCGYFNDFYYKKSTDGGGSWSPRTRLTWGLLGCILPDICTFSNNVIHVAWSANWDNKDIYYKRSTDGGATWSLIKRITWNPDTSRYAKIAADGNSNVFITWTYYSSAGLEIYYVKSTDQGVSWGNLQRFTWNNSFPSSNSTIGIDSSNNVHIIWNNSFAFFHRWSTNAGSTWSQREEVPDVFSYVSTANMVIDPTDTIHFVWQNNPAGNFDIYYTHRDDVYSTAASTGVSQSPEPNGRTIRDRTNKEKK